MATDGVADAVASALAATRSSLADGAQVSIADELAWRCIDDLRGSELVDRIEAWAAIDAAGPGGAPEKFSKEALLVAMMATAVQDLPMLATVWTRVLYTGFSPEVRSKLGVPDPPPSGDERAWAAAYRCVRTRFHRIVACIDYSELAKNRRSTPAEFEQRRRALSPARQCACRDRQIWLLNTVLRCSHKHLPQIVMDRWQGGVAVDSTPVATFARPPRRVGQGKDRRVITHSADPDAGWYVREEDHADVEALPNGSWPTRLLYGYEHTLMFMVPMGEAEKGMYPKLLLAIAPPHLPGAEPGRHAIEALAEVSASTDRRGLLAGDNAYVQARPESFAFPARALGYELVTDYKIDQLGTQGSYDGALLIDGQFYCPAMPRPLIEATLDFRRRNIDEETWRRRLRERRAYELRPKAKQRDDGSIRLMCPAAGTAPTARCSHKPGSMTRGRSANTRISLNHLLRDHPPKVCRQQTITVTAEAQDRYAQPLRHGSDEWHETYRLMRSTNEGGNGTAKDPAFEDLGEAGRRRILGQAANALITCFLHYATNLRLIRSYARFARTDDEGVVRRPTRKRTKKPRGLDQHRPRPATGDPPPGRGQPD